LLARLARANGPSRCRHHPFRVGDAGAAEFLHD